MKYYNYITKGKNIEKRGNIIYNKKREAITKRKEREGVTKNARNVDTVERERERERETIL